MSIRVNGVCRRTMKIGVESRDQHYLIGDRCFHLKVSNLEFVEINCEIMAVLICMISFDF